VVLLTFVCGRGLLGSESRVSAAIEVETIMCQVANIIECRMLGMPNISPQKWYARRRRMLYHHSGAIPSEN